MTKWMVYLLFLPVAIVAAGLFGVAHDQISYSVSPEYFTRFKFIQFGVAEFAAPDRLRAAFVGWRATWWMGLPLGLLAGAAGFLQRDAAAMRRALVRTLPLMILFTLAFSVAGVFFALSRLRADGLAAYANWPIPADLYDPAAFIMVGQMHNFGYLGGMLAIPLAWAFNFLLGRRAAKP
jgi:hypothetical protein